MFEDNEEVVFTSKSEFSLHDDFTSLFILELRVKRI